MEYDWHERLKLIESRRVLTNKLVEDNLKTIEIRRLEEHMNAADASNEELLVACNVLMSWLPNETSKQLGLSRQRRRATLWLEASPSWELMRRRATGSWVLFSGSYGRGVFLHGKMCLWWPNPYDYGRSLSSRRRNKMSEPRYCVNVLLQTVRSQLAWKAELPHVKLWIVILVITAACPESEGTVKLLHEACETALWFSRFRMPWERSLVSPG